MSSLPAELPAPTPIPSPADFPVVWDNPSDAFLLWTNDRMHFPRPVPALEYEVWAAFLVGMNLAGETYGFPNPATLPPHQRLHVPSGDSNHAAGPDGGTGSNRRGVIGARYPTAAQKDREREWLPEVQGILERWRTFHPSAASAAELAAHFEQTMAMASRLGDIHFHVVIPGYLPLGLFEEYFCELFPNRQTRSMRTACCRGSTTRRSKPTAHCTSSRAARG